MSDKPIVSVIIPVFNGAAYIQEAVRSVLNQTFKHIEIIVVDDGSTDDTVSRLAPWIKKGTICLFRQQNKGLSGARNAGLRIAQGEFIKFLDADDTLRPRQLELQVSHLIGKPDDMICVSDVEFEYENGTHKTIRPVLGRISPLARFIAGNLGPPHVFLVRRSLINKAGGFDESLSTCEDSDLWLRIMLLGGMAEKIDYVGCVYRILGGSLDSHAGRRLENICKVYEKLNLALLGQIDRLCGDVQEQLLLKNFSLMHRCFKMNWRPSDRLPTALKVNRIIYAQKADGLKKALLNIIGVESIAFIKYAEALLKNTEYYQTLNIATWRQAG